VHLWENTQFYSIQLIQPTMTGSVHLCTVYTISFMLKLSGIIWLLVSECSPTHNEIPKVNFSYKTFA